MGWNRLRLRTNRVSAYADLPGWWRLMLRMGAVLIGMVGSRWLPPPFSVSLSSAPDRRHGAWKHRIRLSPDDIATDHARIMWGMCEVTWDVVGGEANAVLPGPVTTIRC